MADDLVFNVQTPEVKAPVELNLSGASFVDSVRNGLQDFTDNVRKGSDEALTVVYLGVMFFVAGLYLWRRV